MSLELVKELREKTGAGLVDCQKALAEGGGDVDKALRIMEHMRPARLATIGILGNHDYGSGWVVPEAANRLSRGLANLGVTMLRNEVAEVAGLQIAGMDDWWAGRFDPRASLAALDPERAALALVHNPDVLFLDEPTTGLDPASRMRVWEEVRRLNQQLGMTIFMTTQYLEEADELADRMVGLSLRHAALDQPFHQRRGVQVTSVQPLRDRRVVENRSGHQRRGQLQA